MTILARVFAIAILWLAASPAFAHIGIGTAASFTAGFSHPLGGMDHIAVMLAVGLWAALKGGRALWAWPAAFVGVMLAGAALGMAGMALPFVEPAILASVVVLGLLVAMAANLSVVVGAAIISAVALFHGHAHGNEVTATVSGLDYMAGFALATLGLHLSALAFALALQLTHFRALVRAAGAACATVGIALITGMM